MSKEDLTLKSVNGTDSPVCNERLPLVTENPGSKITTMLLNGENYLSVVEQNLVL